MSRTPTAELDAAAASGIGVAAVWSGAGAGAWTAPEASATPSFTTCREPATSRYVRPSGPRQRVWATTFWSNRVQDLPPVSVPVTAAGTRTAGGRNTPVEVPAPVQSSARRQTQVARP
ncbi:hypothetical protein ACFQ9X_51530 [Catenulispora yoronensis]